MNLEWLGTRCILCLDSGPLSKEHIIPDALGGALTCAFLCTNCNTTLGASVEALTKRDPSIRIAVERLNKQIPGLAGRLREGQKYIAHGPGGTANGTVRGGEFRVQARRAKDGSLIQPPDYARKSVETFLRKDGADEEFVDDALRRFDEAQENERIALSPTLEMVNWTVERIEPSLTGNDLLSPLVPLKIGFEFLACHMGPEVYGNVPPLNELRTVLRKRLEQDPAFHVERLHASEYKPFHGLYFEGNCPHARVLIRLFGWIAFRVHFYRLAFKGPRFAYTHYLDTGEEHIQRVEGP